MRVLIVGSGGREHALAWQCRQSAQVSEVLVAPGNAGTAREPGVRNVDVAAQDIEGLLTLAAAENVALTIVGPEAPLVAGIVDRFVAAGLPCFGPSAAAAQLEGSKAFSKDFMARHRIPTARYRTFSELDPALVWIREQGAPVVVKADGLAAGKGVVVAASIAEAEQAARDMLAGNRFGDAGARIVIEEFLAGEEASFIVMTDGTSVVPLASSQDHKARDEGDAGPNTGGMGACSPAPVITAEVESRILADIVEPTLAGMHSDGTPYRGFLYAGLMIGADGAPKVIEFNCRLGDPETQPILMRLRSDLVAACRATLDGGLDDIALDWDPRAALGVVMAADGYPGAYAKGRRIHGLDGVNSGERQVFHAGTAIKDGDIVTHGGRVLCVVGLGRTVRRAAERAYGTVSGIAWDGAYFRRDIGHRAIARCEDPAPC